MATLCVRVSPAQLDEWRQAASESGVSLSVWVIEILSSELDGINPDWPAIEGVAAHHHGAVLAASRARRRAEK